MVEEESKDGAINTVCTVWNAAPPIDGIRPNGQNLARNILTSFANIILLTIVVSWYCHGIVMEACYHAIIMVSDSMPRS